VPAPTSPLRDSLVIMNTRHSLIPAALVFASALALVGCGGSSGAAPAVTVTADAAPAIHVTVTATPSSDPANSAEPADETDAYDLYLEQNPDPELILSREDAQTRAFLGCGTAWSEGTIDAVLQEIYDPQC